MKAGVLKLSLALQIAAALGLGLCADGEDNPLGVGIKPLDNDTHAQAIACGRSGAECAIMPYRLCPADLDRYSARIATPFSRVASSVYDAKQRRARSEPPTWGSANHWGVGVYVFPSDEFEKAGSIEKVMIQRGDQLIQPTTLTLAPVYLESKLWPRKRASKGYFAFPMEAFLPTSAITVVLVGSSDEVSCRLDRSDLSALR
jgi:hypothetical protein